MNIFYLDTNPQLAAKYHCDKHVVKMIIESAQILSTVLRIKNNNADVLSKEQLDGIYLATHAKHPCVEWAAMSLQNFIWLCELTQHLLEEYQLRYNKVHKTTTVYNNIINIKKQFINDFSVRIFTKPPQCMPTKYKHPDVVIAYRSYYKGEKIKFAKWSHSNPPHWW